MAEVPEKASNSIEEMESRNLLQPSDYVDNFDSAAYLDFYYSPKATTESNSAQSGHVSAIQTY